MRKTLAIAGALLLGVWFTSSLGQLLAQSGPSVFSEQFFDRPQADPSAPDLGRHARGALPARVVSRGITLFLPAVLTPPPPLPPPFPPPTPYSSSAPIDFAAERVALQQQGLELAFNKIGFHTGIYGNNSGLSDWWADLDAAGVPVFLKSVDNAEPLYKVQQLMRQSGISHTLVFRRAGSPWDVPDYNLSPELAARQHWALHLSVWPPELDPSVVWIETINELDKTRADWVGAFALETARLALRDGYRWAGFGWSGGEPEPEDWVTPSMLAYLKLVGENPRRLAVALHEYSFSVGDIGVWYPYLVGRFQSLFQVCDDHFIPRPTVFITEWGWAYDGVPDPELAMQHIRWASWLYAAYPEVKGAAIWYLGGGFAGIADQAQRLIKPVRDYSLSHYFSYVPGRATLDPSLFAPD
jgi:hypothetical protein